MNIRNVAIIQSRMGSRRFPGKMLARLGDLSLLEWVLIRVQQATTLAEVVLAISDRPEDNVLADLASHLDIGVYRGSELDVLARFVGASKMVQASNVVRICADNPFIDPGQIDRLVNYFADNQCDYACNHQDRLGSCYADGFGAEIITAAFLETIANITSVPSHREHVTLYVWDHADEYILRAPTAPPNLAFPALSFDVDTKADLSKLEALVSSGVSVESSAADIVRIALANRQQSNSIFSGVVSQEIDIYLKRLFPLCRSITGEPNRQTLRTLQEIIPLTIHEIPTGTAVYDWSIPDEWSIQEAFIADASGRHIVNFQDNNLHVVSYSEPVDADLEWSQLKSHIHCHPDLPDAIPYRTSYYKRDWGFCVTQAQYLDLKSQQGALKVFINSNLKPGSLSYGEYLIPGRSRNEILLSCYICHPSMANDSLSGVLLTAFLARYIAGIKNRNWSYRIVFVPETIGAIAYCALNEATMKQIDLGLVITTVGGPGKISYKQSFDSTHPINAMIEEVLEENSSKYITYPFDIHGSDERQYSSQGFRINVATICRDRYYEYPYYHSSLDDLTFVTASQITETLDLYVHLIDKFEARRLYRNLIPHCEVMLSRHKLYPVTGGAQLPDSGGNSDLDLILWLLFLCDGKVDLCSIAARLDVTPAKLALIANWLVDKGILELT